MRRMRRAMTGLAVAAAAGAVYFFAARDGPGGGEVVIPALSDSGARGQVAYGRYCASCHGGKADGTDKGPPLIDRIYQPGHHGDASFAAATRRGARGHHWSFGDMKPVEGVSDRELADLIAFIREVQHANGIF